MITALQLIFSPFAGWEKITTAQRGFFWVLCFYLLPLLVLCLGVEAFALVNWGEKRGELGFMLKIPVALAVRYGIAYLVFLLAGVLLSAEFLHLASDSFNVRASFSQCFMVMAYAFGPIILARLLDAIPAINTWVCWTVGASLSTSILYHGVGMVLRPEQTKGFGLYLITILIIFLVSGLAHFAALGVLHRKVLQAQVPDVRSSQLLLDSVPARL